MNVTDQVNERLRAAVHNVAAPAYLETRIRAQIHSTSRQTGGRAWAWLLAPGTAAILCASLLLAYQLGHLRFTRDQQDAYISEISDHVTTLLRVGLGDHVHCAYYRKYPQQAPAAEKFTADLGPDWAGLAPLVRQCVPQGLAMMAGHQCKYQGRKFVHVILKNNDTLLSVVIARKTGGESFRAQGLSPALVQADLPVYQASVQRFQMASFETRDYLVYVISDLSPQKNTAMMQALAQPVKQFLAGRES